GGVQRIILIQELGAVVRSVAFRGAKGDTLTERGCEADSEMVEQDLRFQPEIMTSRSACRDRTRECRRVPASPDRRPAWRMSVARTRPRPPKPRRACPAHPPHSG